MHPLLQALFSPWEWRFEILIILVPLTALYTVGWRRLRGKRGRQSKLATFARLAAYWLGMAVLVTALMSPIDALGGQLFFMHMIQHLLTMMVAAPLLLLANPFPFMLWGLPPGARRAVAGQFAPRARFRRALTAVTQPFIIWFLFIFVYLGWHDPDFYNLALTHDWVHDLQHISFFTVAMLFWWIVIGAGPRLHANFPIWGRMAFVVTAIPPNAIAGAVIAFSPTVIYTYYESIPRIFGLTALQDQMYGGIIMWVPGSMMLLLAMIILLAGQMTGQEPPQPVENWDSDEAMVAPGLEYRVTQNRWRKLQTPPEAGRTH